MPMELLLGLLVIVSPGVLCSTLGFVPFGRGNYLFDQPGRTVLRARLELLFPDTVDMVENPDFEADLMYIDDLQDELPAETVRQISSQVNCGKSLLLVGNENPDYSTATSVMFALFGAQSSYSSNSLANDKYANPIGIFASTVYVGTQNACRVITTMDDRLAYGAWYESDSCVGGKLIYGYNATRLQGAVVIISDSKMVSDDWLKSYNGAMLDTVLKIFDEQISILDPERLTAFGAEVLPCGKNGELCATKNDVNDLQVKFDEIQNDVRQQDAVSLYGIPMGVSVVSSAFVFLLGFICARKCKCRQARAPMNDNRGGKQVQFGKLEIK